MNVYRNGNYLGARGGGGGGRAMVAAAPTVRAPNLPTSRGDDQRRRFHRPMVGWRGGVVPPWLDCDVDEDGNVVCPDDFYLGDLSGRAYKDWTFPEPTGGRYVYRQFDSGDLVILESPSKGKLEEPIRVTRGTKAWRAISSAIYAKQTGKREAVAKAFAQVASVSSALLAAHAKPRRAASKAPTKVEEVEVEEAPEVEEPKSAFPWIPVAIGGAALVGVLAIFGGGKS